MHKLLMMSGLLILSLLVLVYIQETDKQDQNNDALILKMIQSGKHFSESIAFDVMALETGEQLNYDQIATDQMNLRRLNTQLIHGPVGLWHSNVPTLVKRQLALIHQREFQLDETIEDYKTRHAILKNSRHYLSMHSRQDIANQGRDLNINAWRSTVLDFTSDVFAYESNLSFALRQHIMEEIQVWRLRLLTDRKGNQLRLYFLRHIELVIQELPLVNASMNQILNLTRHPYVHLERLYIKQRDAQLNHWAFLGKVFFWLTLIFAGGVLLALLMLHRNAQRLNRVLAELKSHKFTMDQHAIVSVSDIQGNITYANDKLVKSSGYSHEELLNSNHRIFNSGAHSAGFFADLWQTLLSGQVWQGEICNRNKAGTLFWCNSTIVPFLDEHGKPYQFIAIRTDITTRKAAEEALIQAKERAQVILNSVGDAVISIDADLKIDYMNPVAERLAGLGIEEVKAHSRLLDLFDIVVEKTRKSEAFKISNCIKKGHRDILAHHTLINRLDGREFSVEIIIAPTHNSTRSITGAVLAMHDMTDIRGMARKISHQANHDALTGLSNRNEFERILRALLIKSEEENVEHVLCFIDLDHFKVVNDTCGHVAGDELLRQLAKILRDQIRDRDLLARIGGDEFAVLLGECPIDRAREIAAKICHRVKEFRFAWEDKVFQIGASIGLAMINADSVDAVTVMRHADTACYMAKDRGRNGYYVFQEDDEALSQRNGEMQWIMRLTRALDEDLFELYVQKALPISAQPVYYEILIRMRDRDGSLVSPMAFIPAAERHGLMQDIDRWVINTVLRYSAQWHKEDCVIAVNVSGASLSDATLADFLICALREYEVNPKQICFEITETAAIANLGNAIGFIEKLKKVGCLFALDDFGSGLSSFGYLKQLPVDFLKIDGVFIKDMVDDDIDLAMVESINHIGHVMGLMTIAEFVENDAVLEKVKQLGIDYAQGFGISELKPFLSEGQKRPSAWSGLG